MKLSIVPCDFSEAAEFVRNFHRHNKPPIGSKFCIGASNGARLVGVVIVGRPVARGADNGSTLEVTRCCVNDSERNACSFLYGAAWRATKALGYERLITYTLQSESGSSLRGAGWKVVAQLKARDPKSWLSRSGREWQPVVGQAKLRWEVTA